MVQQKFEEAFSKYSKSRKDALNPSEIFAMLRGNRNILDPTGWTAAALEWYALWWVAGDEEVRNTASYCIARKRQF